MDGWVIKGDAANAAVVASQQLAGAPGVSDADRLRSDRCRCERREM